MSKQIEKLPDEQVEVVMAKCPKCKHPVLIGIKHTIDKRFKKELADLVAEGGSAETVSLLKYRELIKERDWDMCDTKCVPAQ